MALSHNWTRVKFTVRSDGWQIFLPGLFCNGNTCRGAVNFLLCLRSLLIGILNILPLPKMKTLDVFYFEQFEQLSSSSQMVQCMETENILCFLIFFKNYI